MPDIVTRLREMRKQIVLLPPPPPSSEFPHAHVMTQVEQLLRDAGFTEGACEAADEIERLRAALMWTLDRASVDGGMTPKECQRTALGVELALRGSTTTVAVSYTPEPHTPAGRWLGDLK